MERRSRLNPSDAQLEKRIAAEDRPQQLVLSGTWDLPFGKGKALASGAGRVLNRIIGGWMVNGIYIVQPGPPLGWGNVIYLGGDLRMNPRGIDNAFDTTRFNRDSRQQLASNIRTFPSRFANLRAGRHPQPGRLPHRTTPPRPQAPGEDEPAIPVRIFQCAEPPGVPGFLGSVTDQHQLWHHHGSEQPAAHHSDGSAVDLVDRRLKGEGTLTTKRFSRRWMLNRAGLAAGLARLGVWPAVARPEVGAGVSVDIRQITFGPRHHFFGYIGHVRTIPWNRSGRYIVGLANLVSGSHAGGSARPPKSCCLTPQRDYSRQRPSNKHEHGIPSKGPCSTGTPNRPETQFFFNDRDPGIATRFSPCCSIFPKDGGWREYRFPETPFGNSGVAQGGGSFLGLNYGRMSRLRPVTGYPGAYDWTTGANHPDNDGVFKVDTATKKGQADRLLPAAPGRAARLPSRGRDDRIVHQPYAVEPGRGPYIFLCPRQLRRAAGASTGCRLHGESGRHEPPTATVGAWAATPSGSPDIAWWAQAGGRQVIYDTDRQEIAGTLGDRTILPSPGGDIALSPDGRLFVNGYRRNGIAYDAILRRSDSAHVRTRGFDIRPWINGETRCDPAPCWNRDGTQILFPAIAGDPGKTRQMFLIRLSGLAS